MQQKIELVQLAILKLLKPVVKLALNTGLKYAELDHLMRTVLLEEAKLVLSETDRRGNVSQLASVTGLHRKDLSVRVKQAQASLVDTQMSVPSRVYTRWLQLSRDHADLAQLTVAQNAEQEICFESLVLQETKGDVHYKTVLDELERLGVVQVSEGTVAIDPKGFVPSNDYQLMMSFLADNTSDHLLAAVHNITQAPLFLERSVFADGLTEQACQQLQKATRERWNDTHSILFDNILKAEEASAASGSHRMRIGIYTYYEPMQAATQPDGVGERATSEAS
jgi:Family of unknown function (DUF6502)